MSFLSSTLYACVCIPLKDIVKVPHVRQYYHLHHTTYKSYFITEMLMGADHWEHPYIQNINQ